MATSSKDEVTQLYIILILGMFLHNIGTVFNICTQTIHPMPEAARALQNVSVQILKTNKIHIHEGKTHTNHSKWSSQQIEFQMIENPDPFLPAKMSSNETKNMQLKRYEWNICQAKNQPKNEQGIRKSNFLAGKKIRIFSLKNSKMNFSPYHVAVYVS